jgi:leucyl-tRNA synthetase
MNFAPWGREAQLICRAPVVFMVKQSRQQAKFKALLAERAHFMRHNATEEERILWRCVAGKRLGVSFRRQFVIGRYIVDLVAPSARLVVEVDGGYHSRRVAADARRDRALQRLGYRVLRLPAELVRCNLPEAVACIQRVLSG